jgi:hypothetical protein
MLKMTPKLKKYSRDLLPSDPGIGFVGWIEYHLWKWQSEFMTKEELTFLNRHRQYVVMSACTAGSEKPYVGIYH